MQQRGAGGASGGLPTGVCEGEGGPVLQQQTAAVRTPREALHREVRVHHVPLRRASIEEVTNLRPLQDLSNSGAGPKKIG